MATHVSILAWEIPWVEEPAGCTVIGVANAAAAANSLQSCPTLCDPIDGSPQAPSSLGFSRQEHWSGLPFPSPGDRPDPGIEPRLLYWHMGSLPAECSRGSPLQLETRWECGRGGVNPGGKSGESNGTPLQYSCLENPMGRGSW